MTDNASNAFQKTEIIIILGVNAWVLIGSPVETSS